MTAAFRIALLIFQRAIIYTVYVRCIIRSQDLDGYQDHRWRTPAHCVLYRMFRIQCHCYGRMEEACDDYCAMLRGELKLRGNTDML